jgi:flagellin
MDAITDTATGTVTATYDVGTATGAPGNFWGPNQLNGPFDFGLGGNIGGNIANASAEYTLSSTINDAGGNDITLKNVMNTNGGGGVSLTVYAWDAGSAGTSGTTTGDPIDKLHVGANKNQTIDVNLPDLSSNSLGIDNIDISTTAGAESAISTLDSAINQISSSRASIGASVNQLEHAMNFAGIAEENQQAAESRIRDADYASEMIEYTKNQILSQASQSMLTQANMRPQSVLQMLQGI